MKNLILLILLLLTLFTVRSQTSYPNKIVLYQGTYYGLFNKIQCDSILNYIYSYEYYKEQTNNLTEQVRFLNLIDSTYERKIADLEKVNTALNFEATQTANVYKTQALQYSALSGKYDKLLKRQKWYWAAIGILTLIIIVK